MIDRPELFKEYGRPWSKRAAISPRKTYSAESKIVYKRKVHYFSTADLERIMKIVQARAESNKKDKSFWQKLLSFLRDKIIEMMENVLINAHVEWIGDPWVKDALNQILRGTNDVIIDSPYLSPDTRNTTRIAFESFYDSFEKALNEIIYGKPPQ